MSVLILWEGVVFCPTALVTPGGRVVTGFCVLTGRFPAASAVVALVTEAFVAAVELIAGVTS